MDTLRYIYSMGQKKGSPIIIHGLGLFLFVLRELHCLQFFIIMMHYTQLNYMGVQSFAFTSAVVSEVRLLKQKKKKKENNNNWLK